MVEQIIAAARASFAHNGWAGTTMRAIAREVDVDPALVHYYFASKEDLLDAATMPPEEWLEADRGRTTPQSTRRAGRVWRNSGQSRVNLDSRRGGAPSVDFLGLASGVSREASKTFAHGLRG